MTREGLITVRESVGKDEAKRLLHQHRIEKLLVVDGEYRCIGLITVKDIEKAQLYPHACKDEQGRLRVAAAAGTGRAELERAEALFAAGVDIMVVDTAHGHSSRVIDTVSEIRRMSNYTQLIVGNVATAEGARAVRAAGADCAMLGSLFAGTDESPGEVFLFQGRSYKYYRGMGSIGAMARGSADRYFQQEVTST